MARLLTRLYPPAWRERYGEEYAAMLELGPVSLSVFADGVWSAVREHMNPTCKGVAMREENDSFAEMMRRPSGFLPVTLSMMCLVMVLSSVAVGVAKFGYIVRDEDEGAVAHLFQIMMTAQWPIMAFLLIKWLRRAPRPTMRVLAVQTGAWLAACAPVYFFHL
jgi:hypothetical protein